jgi:hypothetical protein
VPVCIGFRLPQPTMFDGAVWGGTRGQWHSPGDARWNKPIRTRFPNPPFQLQQSGKINNPGILYLPSTFSNSRVIEHSQPAPRMQSIMDFSTERELSKSTVLPTRVMWCTQGHRPQIVQYDANPGDRRLCQQLMVSEQYDNRAPEWGDGGPFAAEQDVYALPVGNTGPSPAKTFTTTCTVRHSCGAALCIDGTRNVPWAQFLARTNSFTVNIANSNYKHWAD